MLAAEKFEGKPGQLSHLYTDGRLRAARVLVVGLGPAAGGRRRGVRRGTASALRRARDLGAASVAVVMPADGLPARARAQAIVEGAVLGTYRFDRYLKEKNDKTVESLAVVEPDRRNQRGGARGRAGRRASGPRPRASRATSSTSPPTW